MNFETAFVVEIAKLGVWSMDGRMLDEGGTWRIRPSGAPVLHGDILATTVGVIEQVTTMGQSLMAQGWAVRSVAQALHEGTVFLAMGMQEYESEMDEEGRQVFVAGTIVAAKVLPPADNPWREGVL